MIKEALILTLTIILTMPLTIFSQGSESHILTLEDAERIAAAAELRANQDNWTVVIAVVDSGGHLVLLRRIDGTQTGSIEVAIQKAKTSVLYKRPTKAFQDGIAAGNVALLNLPNVLPLEGGIPIMNGDIVIGGIGVSGVTAEQDGIIARAGLDAL